MPIYQRGKSKTWWIDFTTPNGQRVRQSSSTQDKQQAQELHDRLKSESWRTAKLGDKPRYTWQQAIVKWFQEKSDKKSLRDDLKYLRWLNTYFKGLYLDEITKSKIDFIREEKLKTGVKHSSVNNLLGFIRSVLNVAKNEWEWIDSVPAIKMFAVRTQRLRWLTHEEADRLLKELPEHLNAMVRFSLATGLRESNVTHLEWQQIDMQRRCAWIYGDQAKSGKDIAVPLNDEAIEVIKEQIGKHQVRVFTFRGKPVKNASNDAFQKAVKRAGIENFCWHCLRHTWASWHIQNGTPLQVLKELGGWSDLTMVMRYAHLSSEHLQQYAGNLQSKNIGNGTNLAQVKKTA